LKVVVSVEIDDEAMMVVDSWCKTTDENGKLIHIFKDLKDLDTRATQGLIDQFGGLDLMIGGSPYNNLSGNMPCSHIGLVGLVSENCIF
jgi:site-specific DNA-cytosine methylase